MVDPGRSHSAFELPIGAEVVSTTGHKLGNVQEVRGDSFKVNAPMQPDYWLPARSVVSATSSRVVVQFHHEELDDEQDSESDAA
jgi:hypothetical protein